MDTSIIKPMVKKILECPLGHDWTLQGLGMLRLYLTPEVRMHVWDSRFRVDGVSQMHTHPWTFKSYVVEGDMQNRRWLRVKKGGQGFFEQKLKCGAGACLKGKPLAVRLDEEDAEYYRAGGTYTQLPDEIHSTHAAIGTVTIIERTVGDRDPDHAFVYYVNNFVSAEPRKATQFEVLSICGEALSRWFK